MATTSNRAATVTSLVSILADLLPGYSVTDGEPPALERDCVWVGDIATRQLNLDTWGTASRRQRLDVFQVHLHIWAGSPGQTAAEARARCEEMYADVEDVLATNPKLDGLDGLMSAIAVGYDGPNVVPEDAEGWAGAATVSVECQSTLT